MSSTENSSKFTRFKDKVKNSKIAQSVSNAADNAGRVASRAASQLDSTVASHIDNLSEQGTAAADSKIANIANEYGVQQAPRTGGTHHKQCRSKKHKVKKCTGGRARSRSRSKAGRRKSSTTRRGGRRYKKK